MPRLKLHHSQSVTYRLPVVLGIVSLGGLYAISRYNFLLFHCLAEAFSIVIAVAVFAIFWNTRQFFEHSAWSVIGLGCLFAGLLDLIYIFAYPGMSVFPNANGNIALQAKTVAQWYVSFSCVGAFLFLRRNLNKYIALFVYSGLFALAIGSIFFWRVFPDCFVDGVGITRFARIGLVISSSAYLGALALLAVNRREFDSYVLKLIAAVLMAFFVQDAACAVAIELDGVARTVAHLCQVVALYFVYRAFVEVGLRKPYALLLRSQQQSTEALQTIFDSVPAGIFYKDKENRLLRVNQAFADIMGMAREQLEGRSIFDLYPRDQAEAFWRDDQEIIGLGRTKCNIVEPMQTATHQGWFQTDKIPYRDSQGNIIGVIGFLLEITERKQAEEALRASEERYRLLVETIPQLAWRSSPDGMDIDCNRRWYEYTGQTPTQARAHGWLAAIHPDDLFRVTEEALHAANNREPYQVEYRLRRAADGSYRWHLARAIPALDEDGQVVCWYGSATDIEDLKQAQDVLNQAHEKQLQNHRNELAHVARLSVMGEMAAGLAHELNQPLHAINNYASGSLMRVLKTTQRDPELVAALERVSEEANRAAEIVRRVRRFVQKSDAQFSEVHVNGLVEEVVLFSSEELEQRRVKIVLELAEDLPLVAVDPVQIQQIITNLVRNGLEAMDETPEECRLLNIRTMQHDDELVHVTVSDRGCGIDEDYREKVFEPFFTTKPEGMGMGLAISRSIIRAHGGDLWQSTNPGQGCTFHFTLPVGKRS